MRNEWFSGGEGTQSPLQYLEGCPLTSLGQGFLRGFGDTEPQTLIPW